MCGTYQKSLHLPTSTQSFMDKQENDTENKLPLSLSASFPLTQTQPITDGAAGANCFFLILN